MSTKPKLGSGQRFKNLENKVEEQQESKGVPSPKAQKIAKAVAASVGIKKYGQKKMTQLAQKGKFTPKTKGEKQAGGFL